MNTQKLSGYTLLELTIVLLILIVLAGIAQPYLTSTTQTALCDATDVTMQNIKKVIMERYYLDTLGHFPASKGGTDYNLKYLFEAGGWSPFDPETQIGWRTDGYLQNGIVLSKDSFKGSAIVNDDILAGQTQVLDAWGRPIILQIPTKANCDAMTGLTGTKEAYCARLVSAGFGSGLGATDANIETLISGNRPNGSDDRILYLNKPTPELTPNCNP